jgi:hypothetical protein
VFSDVHHPDFIIAANQDGKVAGDLGLEIEEGWCYKEYILFTSIEEKNMEQLPPVPPTAPVTSTGDKKGLAIASLILGVLSLCGSIFWFCGAPLSIAGVVLGFLGLKSSGKGMAIAGIILSAVGLLLMVVFIIIAAVSGPVFDQIQQQLLQSGY